MTDGNIADLEVLLGHVFRDKQFIFNALSHSSTKTDDRPSNERMEFLGDSVLGTICAEALYRRYPDANEGELTRIKSAAVSRATLERVAQVMGLERFILVGKGVRKKAIPSSLIGNMFEAIVGAIYLDAGLAATRKFVLRQLDVVMEEIVSDRAERNYKSMLQHYCQRELGGMPSYRVLREAGPAHNRNYEIAVVVKGDEVGRAAAASKKEAEQGAARAALLHYKAIDEQPIETVRGAGTVLRVGPTKPKRKSRSRRSKRGGDGARDAAAPAPETKESKDSADAPATGEKGPAHTPTREGESSRRSRGGRRRRGGRGRGGRGRGGQTAAANDGNNRPNGGDRSEGRREGERTERRPAQSESGRKDTPKEAARPEAPKPAPQSAAAPKKKAAKKKAAKKKAAKKTAKKKAAKKKAAKKTAAKKTAKKKAAKKAAKKKATKKKAAQKPRAADAGE